MKRREKKTFQRRRIHHWAILLCTFLHICWSLFIGFFSSHFSDIVDKSNEQRAFKNLMTKKNAPSASRAQEMKESGQKHTLYAWWKVVEMAVNSKIRTHLKFNILQQQKEEENWIIKGENITVGNNVQRSNNNNVSWREKTSLKNILRQELRKKAFLLMHYMCAWVLFEWKNE